MYAKTLIAFLIMVFAAGAGVVFLQKGFSRYLAGKAEEAFGAGNYLASLVGYSAAEKRLFSWNEDVVQKIEESKDLLVAEVNFEKAKKAAEEGDWLEAKALLSGDPAMINTSFTHYEEAIGLFLEASEKMGVLEKKIEAELQNLKIEAAKEKDRRESAEAKAAETQTQLQSTIAEKAKTEQVLRSEIEKKASEAEKARVDAEAERLLKFKNEINVYVSILMKGNGYLDSALLEIGNKKDVTALLFAGQAKALFDEAEARGKDMLAERTSENLKVYTQKLLQAASFLVDASRRTGSLVFYIGKENESEFKTLNQEISERKNSASQLIQELQNFVK